jgi:hypothetical protein
MINLKMRCNSLYIDANKSLYYFTKPLCARGSQSSII